MRKMSLLLLLILSISLLAQELDELSIIGKALKTNDIVSSSIKDVNNRKASCIIFLTDLEVDMDFKPNIELVKLISNAGKHEVYVQPGERVIEVLASGFKPLNLVLSSYGISKLESGDVYQIEITGNKKTIIASEKGNLILKTIPENAKISIDEFPDFNANTPYEFNNYLARPYHFHFYNKCYYAVDTLITVKPNEMITKIIKLKPKMASISIKSTPSNINNFDIIINGKKQKKHPPVKIPLIIGNYDILLKHPKYLDQTKKIYLKENDKKEILFKMQTYKGSILAQKNFYKKRMWFGVISSAVIAGGGLYFNISADAFYNEYTNATDPNICVDKRTQYKNHQNYRNICYYTSLVPLVYSVYNFFKKGTIK